MKLQLQKLTATVAMLLQERAATVGMKLQLQKLTATIALQSQQ